MGSNIKYATCAGCFLSKKARAGIMLPHNRWSMAKRAMVSCSGSGHPPASKEQLLKAGMIQVYRR